MKLKVILFSYLIIALSVSSYSIDFDKHDILNDEVRITFQNPYEEVWAALLMSLSEDSLEIRYINSIEGCIKSNYVYLPVKLKNSLVEGRLTSMTKFDEKLAIWSDELCYSYIIIITSIDSLNTLLRINTEIYIYESNTTYKNIYFKSNGSLERELISKTKAKLKKLNDERNNITYYINDVFLWDSYSGESRCIINRSKNEIWPVLLKIINDNLLLLKFEDQNFGIIYTQNLSLNTYRDNSVYVEEFEVKGIQKIITSWSDEYRFSVKISVTPLNKDNSRSEVYVQTAIEKYEAKTAKWYKFRSTDVFEEELLSLLKSSLIVFSPMDRIPYFNIHLDSVITRIYYMPITTVWNSIVRTLQEKKFKIECFEIDSCIYGVTNYRFIQGSYISLEFIIEKINEEQSKISITSSIPKNNPYNKKVGIGYEKSSNSFIQDFLESVASNMDKRYSLERNINEYIDSLSHQMHLSVSDNKYFINNIESYQSVSLIPGYNIFLNGISVSCENGDTNLFLSGYVNSPFEFDSTDDIMLSVANWVFSKLVFNMGNSIFSTFKDPEMFDNIVFETKIKILNWDDSTPLDMSYQTFRIKIKTVNLLDFVTFRTVIDKIIHSSNIEFKGETVNIK